MTYEPIPYATPVGPPPIENSRRGWLIGFGIVSILIGSVAGCMSAVTLLAVVMMGFLPGGAQAGMFPADVAVAVVIDLGTAVIFIWAGIDSIRCRRWVRPVVIAVGWITMAGAVFGLAGLIVAMCGGTATFGPGMSTVTTTSPSGTVVTTTTGAASTFTMATTITTIAAMVVLGLIVPGAFVWFYSTGAVKSTLEAYQPEASWTERCPLPIFVACAGLLLGGVSTAAMAIEESTPFFGMYLEGAAAVGMALLSAIVMLAAMVLMFRMSVIGWWLAFLVIALGFTSAIMTFAKLGMLDFYRRGHASASDLQMLTSSSAMMGIAPIIMSGVLGIFCLAYLLWVHRYFRRPLAAIQ
jgi:hypothetical protein